ncbi:MAG: SsrA-binding protein SmpB [Negativicutes bacterium]
MQTNKIKIVTENRKARHDFHIIEKYETGIALTGTEVKSLRQGKCNLQDSHVAVNKNVELILCGCHISPYEQGNINNHEPLRERKLLMHKSEILKLFSKTREKGLTLIPLKMYFTRGKVKVEIALASGKKQHDKRQDIAERDAKRDIARIIKSDSRNE